MCKINAKGTRLPPPHFLYFKYYSLQFFLWGSGWGFPLFLLLVFVWKTYFDRKRVFWLKQTIFRPLYSFWFIFSQFLFIFNPIWCQNPISVFFLIFAVSISWNFYKGKEENRPFPQFFLANKICQGVVPQLTEKFSHDSNWRARQLKIGSYSTKIQWVTKSTKNQ